MRRTMDAARIEALRAAIVRQADEAGPDGWLDLPMAADVRASGILRVPRGAFEHWAVRTTGGDHLATPWRQVSPQGVKQGADDPFHTDWMLGAGLNPSDMRHGGPDPALTEALNDAAYAGKAEVERRLLGFACSVLLSGPDVRGRAWHPKSPTDTRVPFTDEPPVAVIRDARPDWLDLAGKVLALGGAVVVERGGEMAHLVTVMREGGKGPLVRVAGALRLYPEGLLLDVAPGRGRIEIKDDGRLPQPTAEQWDPQPEPPPRPAPARATPQAASPAKLVPCGGDNPADRQTYLCFDKSYKVDGPKHQAYGVVTSNMPPSADHPSWDTPDYYLVIRIYERGSGRAVQNYYAGKGLWPFEQVKAAANQALDIHDVRVDPNIRWDREAAERQARQTAYEARLAGMSDAELLGHANGKVTEERRFLGEVEEGKWDLSDQNDIGWDFTAAFSSIDMALYARGLTRDERVMDLESACPAP